MLLAVPSLCRTREAWLQRLVALLRPIFAEQGYEMPGRIRVSCSWPSSRSSSVFGQAFSASASADGAHETFVSPRLEQRYDVGSVLVYELAHHAVGVEKGHGPAFRKCAIAVGLCGPMRSSTPDEPLARRVNAICAALGPYPHGALHTMQRVAPQTTRMLLVVCGRCGCKARLTRFWLDAVGAPTCGCGGAMELFVSQTRRRPSELRSGRARRERQERLPRPWGALRLDA